MNCRWRRAYGKGGLGLFKDFSAIIFLIKSENLFPGLKTVLERAKMLVSKHKIKHKRKDNFLITTTRVSFRPEGRTWERKARLVSNFVK